MNITLPYPPSANRYWRHGNGRVYRSTEADTYRIAVGWLCKELGTEPLVGNVRVTVNAFRPRKVGDLDNIAKQLLDSMQGHIYVDDSQIIELHLMRHDDKANPRVEVEVLEVVA